MVMSPDIFSMNERTESSEGLDVKMAIHYYGRILIIYDLLLTILAAITGDKPDVNDLDLKKTYSLKRCNDCTVTYSDLVTQAFAEKAPLASFIHADPGVVATSLVNGLPWYVRIPAKALTPFIARSPADCAKLMMSTLTKDEFASGWHLVNKNVDKLQPTKFQTKELKEVVWNHSVMTIENVLQQNSTEAHP